VRSRQRRDENRLREQKLADTASQREYATGVMREQSSLAEQRDVRQFDREQESEKKNKKEPNLLDLQKDLYDVLGRAMPNATPEATNAVAAGWDGKTPIWEVVHAKFPQGYPRNPSKDGKEPKKTYDTIQDAYRDASQRFGQDYTPDSLQALATVAFQTQQDVGMVEGQGRSNLSMSPYGTAKKRKALADAVQGADDSLSPGLVQTVVDDVIRREKEGQLGEDVFKDSIGAVKQNQLATEVLIGMKWDPNQRAQEVDLARLNQLSGPIQFTPPEDGGAPTIQDVIVDASAQGMDVRQIQVLLSRYLQASMVGPARPERQVQMVPRQMGRGGI